MNNIIHVKGDLLNNDCNIIIHQCNCNMGWGAGISGQIGHKFPYAYEAFKNDYREPIAKLGDYSIGYPYSVKNPLIYNLYGQLRFGRDKNTVYTNYDAFEKSLTKILNFVIEYENKNYVSLKVGLPYLIGCGLANGDWNIVYNIIKKIADEFNHDIYLYEYQPKG